MGGHPDPGEPRRYPSTVGGLIYLVVLAGTLLGLVIVVSGSWRMGVRWVGLSLIGAAIARLVLPGRQAGMLAVRHPAFDATLLSGVGAALVLLAGSIPDQPL